MAILLVSILLGVAACSRPWVGRSGEVDALEWRGQIVELNRPQGYVVVRSTERLLDHAFQLTRETKITAEDGTPPSLQRGQWVTVQYREDKSDQGPPVAVRIFVIR